MGVGEEGVSQNFQRAVGKTYSKSWYLCSLWRGMAAAQMLPRRKEVMCAGDRPYYAHLSSGWTGKWVSDNLS